LEKAVAQMSSITFSSAVATFYEVENNWAPSQMIDGIFTGPGGGINGWAVYDYVTFQADGADALLTLATPLPAGKYELTFTIYQNYYGNPGHLLGDFTLDYTTAQSPTLTSSQIPVSIETASSLNGTTFTFPSAGELLANSSQNLIGTDTYTITALIDSSSPITGIFLDALKNSSLPANGPGLAYNGNFVVSEFTLDAVPIDTQGKLPGSVVLPAEGGHMSQFAYNHLPDVIDKTGLTLIPPPHGNPHTPLTGIFEAQNDSFIFQPNFGSDLNTLPAPASIPNQFGDAISAEVSQLLDAAHDAAISGSGAIVADAHTIHDAVTNQLKLHSDGFHFA
jgi:hypothetical protein